MSLADKRSLLTLEAGRRVADVRSDPHGRLALAEESYVSATNSRLERFSRAELAFIEWEIRRGVLEPIRPSGEGGSSWWRTINEMLLQDCAEASLLHREGFRNGGSTPAVGLWLKFFSSPSPDTWYRAHNASIVSGYLAASHLAGDESPGEQVLMNVILTRALYASLLASKQARLGPLARIGEWLANPAGGGIVAVIDLPDFYPATYPMDKEDTEQLLGVGFSPQSLLGRLANLLIFSDLERVFAWNAQKIGIPGLMALTADGEPCYPSGRPTALRLAASDAAVVRKLDDAFDDLAAAATPDNVMELLPWVAGVSLQDVCFLSWEVPDYAIAAILPDGLEADTYEGKCYISAVALRAEGMHFRGLPPLPGAGSYVELNLRTYVKHRGERGIWFISVDGTPGDMFEFLARHMFRIPYHESVMDLTPGTPMAFTSTRPDDDAKAAFDLRYTVDESSPAAEPAPGSFEEFICKRDLAFSTWLGLKLQLEVRHPQWTVQPVTGVQVDATALFEAAHLSAPAGAPTAFYSPRSDGVMLLPVPA
jgi:uncharacterized protein YqjF (DUF2071 family)